MNGQDVMLLALVGIGWVFALYHQSCKLLGLHSKKQ